MLKKELIIATKNQGKFREIRKILKDCGFRLRFLGRFKNAPCIKENGYTFLENAKKKALETACFFNCLSVGEDSGLVVPFLGGAPGIRSARFSRSGRDEDNNRKLLRLLEGVPFNKRRAYFICTLALASPEGIIKTFQGKVYGYIDFIPKGKNGFGYDPLFYIPQYKKTFAQLLC